MMVDIEIAGYYSVIVGEEVIEEVSHVSFV